MGKNAKTLEGVKQGESMMLPAVQSPYVHGERHCRNKNLLVDTIETLLMHQR